jgi:hypothetical protein
MACFRVGAGPSPALPGAMKNTFTPIDMDNERINRLSSLIEERFGYLAPDEVDILAGEFTESTTQMVEIIDVKPRSALLMDLFEDIEFKPVALPKEMLPYLRRHDTFLATLGYRDNKWEVVYMSPPYANVEFE